jgi:two-component system CheB/CheR fusion protein
VTLKVIVSPGINDAVYGDQGRLRQILINIIGNAVKFTEKGSVEISVEVRENDGEGMTLLFCVADTGIGIPEDKQQAIFESFVQVDHGIARKYEGTGLGLTIAKKLVEAMGGKIWLESQLGQGSRFFVELSFGALPDARRGEPNIPPKVFLSQPLNVLLAEDNKVNQFVIVKFLERRNVSVVVATNGLEAIEKLKGGDFDLILTDIRMPLMCGDEAVRLIRQGEAGEKNRDKVIVAMTADVMPNVKKKLFDIGINDFLDKPVDCLALDQLLLKVFNQKYKAAKKEVL